MRKLFIMSLLLISQSVFSYDANKEYSIDDAVALANRFITKLRANTPFLYEDEVAFFGEKTLYSYVILHKLGYVDEKGKWIKAKPKYSYLCELIRLNSSFILLDKPKSEYYFSGIPRTVTENGLLANLFYAKIAFIQEQDSSSYGPSGDVKNIIIGYRIPQKRLDLPIFIDGKHLVDCLGFIPDSKGVPELGKNELDKLIKHISSLENH